MKRLDYKFEINKNSKLNENENVEKIHYFVYYNKNLLYIYIYLEYMHIKM